MSGEVPTLPELFAGMGDLVVVRTGGDVSGGDVSGGDVSGGEIERRYSAAEVAELADQTQAGLRSLGLERGDRLAIWLPNGVEYIAVLWAAARLGVVVVSINTRFRSTEVADIVGRSGARQLVLDPSFLGIDFVGILSDVDPDQVPLLEGLVTLGERATDHRWPWPAVSFAELCGHGVDTSDVSEPDMPYIVFTTSGTTRAPKLVLHLQSSTAAHAADLASWFGRSALVAVPLCGVFGHTVMLGALGAGSTQVMLPVFDGATAAHAVERHGIETFHGSDEMIARMVEAAVEAAVEQPVDLTSLGPVGYARFNNALEDIPERAASAGLTAIGLYGMSEVHALYAHRPPEPADRVAVPGGQLVSPGAAARVADPETNEVLGDGVDGELQLKGPSRFAGYLADGGAEIDHALTDEHMVDGWFRTGDLARMDGPNSFEYLARMGDVLRLGGFLVSPAEIEARLIDHPSVEAAQVVAVDLVGGPRAVAFVTVARSGVSHDGVSHDGVPQRGAMSAEPFDEDAVRMFCRSGLAGYKVPARVVVIDEFPTTASANGTKIQKVRLREQAALLFE